MENEVTAFFILIISFVGSQMILERSSIKLSLISKVVISAISLVIVVYLSIKVFYTPYLFIVWLTFITSYCLKLTRSWMKKINRF
ncbi:hypothetical protein [Vagococcus intermedius]|uniref:Uncharacterized protein n=1 Tax=Vagococcus intermedius TaxID=2991418 RepID=A0AAF0CUJ6_9ENTE|nr:hypothetical protein [Vagococcus intermedius]WEG73137.1 hypothetical protein OL234_09260 [Vagococcus intermedius]WEG75221.1 hypothetical protein OL235_09255 [Vagococcus intermedius]